jgi:diguanylate cyclase (GGDEF)-like protein
MHQLVELTTALQRASTLESMMSTLAERLAAMLSVPRVSVRLLDETRSRLLTSARAGAPLHDQALDFTPGEGLIGWVVEHGKMLRCADGESDARFVAKPGMTSRLGSFLGVPLMDGASCIGVISAVDPASGRFSEADEQLVSLASAMVLPHLQIARLRRLAQVDPLTGALNRRGFDDAFTDDAWSSATTISIAAADIDHFKTINDRHGHAIGDRVLQAVAGTLASVVRRGDAVVRMGGEEFLLVLIGADASAAAQVAERARRAIDAQPIVIDGVSIAVTSSFGVAERRGAESRTHALERADAALYRAKAAGRNRVELAD